MQMSVTVYLCGFMGCGKSTVGEILSRRLRLPFTDMDSFITEREKMPIPQIFAEKGEEYFRERETEAVRLLGERGGVIACGGGAMLRSQNGDIAAGYGTVVYIDVPFDVCYERIKDDDNRPIVKANTRESLEEIYNSRKPLYTAHSGICTNGCGTPEEIADRIISAIS